MCYSSDLTSGVHVARRRARALVAFVPSGQRPLTVETGSDAAASHPRAPCRALSCSDVMTGLVLSSESDTGSGSGERQMSGGSGLDPTQYMTSNVRHAVKTEQTKASREQTMIARAQSSDGSLPVVSGRAQSHRQSAGVGTTRHQQSASVGLHVGVGSSSSTALVTSSRRKSSRAAAVPSRSGLVVSPR